jgi:antitoxin component HigA of HigAB toxin-antitoxin module
MNKINYDNIVRYIIDNFPEFKEYDKEYIDAPYIIIASFGDFLTKRIEAQDKNDKVVSRALDLINNLFTDSDTETKLLDLINIEIFEHFAGSKQAIIFSRSFLAPKAREYFEKTMIDFGIESMKLRSR